MSRELHATMLIIPSYDEIKHFIKQDILIERLEIECDCAEAIDEQAGLFDPDAIGLDSVEALEIVAALEGAFSISFQGLDEEAMREHFYSIQTLAMLVQTLLAGAFPLPESSNLSAMVDP